MKLTKEEILTSVGSLLVAAFLSRLIALNNITLGEQIVKEITTPTKVESVNHIVKENIVEDAKEELSLNELDLRELSNISTEEMENALQDTNMCELAPIIVEVEEIYNVNALMFASIVALESGWNNSNRALNDNNLTGYAIYSDDSEFTFDSVEDNLYATARLLDDDYLTEDGKYFNGRSIEDIGKKYSADPLWSSKVSDIANRLYSKVEN